jgi:Domain of unknown function (DUF4160)
MPIVSSFYGVAIMMYLNDHGLPHFHVSYQGFMASVSIADGTVIEGRLPPRIARMVRVWCERRRTALKANWDAARRHGRIERIPGLDAD